MDPATLALYQARFYQASGNSTDNDAYRAFANRQRDLSSDFLTDTFGFTRGQVLNTEPLDLAPGGQFDIATNNYLPMLSAWRFGNATLANLGQSQAWMSGNIPWDQNLMFAGYNPQSMADNYPLPIGDQNIPGGINPQQTDPNAGAAVVDGTLGGESRIWHLIKLEFVGIAALVFLAVGLYMIIRQTDTGKKIEGAAVDALEVAAIA